MIKRSRFTKALFTLALTGTLCFSSVLSASAKTTDTILSWSYGPESENQAAEGRLGIELKVTDDNDDDSDILYYTPHSTFKLNCTSPDVMPDHGDGTSFVSAYIPYSVIEANGGDPANMMPVDAWDMGTYWKEVPYSFGQEIEIFTPELIDYISKNSPGILFAGFSSSGLEFVYWTDRYWFDPTCKIDDFILTDTTPAAPAETPAAPTETQPAPEEAATEAPAQTETPTPVAPADSSDLPYTVAKYDTLGVIALNYYGSYNASSLLYDVNRDILSQTNNRPKEGTQLRLPAVLGDYTRIAPPQITGNEKLYCVMVGDTLKSIANKVYGDSSMYQNILNRNSDRIKDANHIYEGQIIVCP